MPGATPGGAASGPVLFAYDGSELAGAAILEAASRLPRGLDAVVVCVWQPADVGFSPVDGSHFDAANAAQVHAAAEVTAAHGAELAGQAGFQARGLAVESAPTWKGIVDSAEATRATVIVIASHRHPGLVGHLVGNVASAVVAHAAVPVLVVPDRACATPT